MRRPGSALAALGASPVLVGAVTVMITIVAVMLAYTANNGLPFVPTYDLRIQLPNANTLVRGNEVRIGGIRVGRVESVTAERLEDGRPVAVATVQLNEEVEPLPVDSTVVVRPRSSIALKYLEINPGNSSDGYETGATLPMSAARPEPVELDQVINTFDEQTRESIQRNLTGFGNAFAGRGPALNEVFRTLRTLTEVAEPAAANLASPRTGLGRFWNEVSAAAAETAPVATTLGELWGNLDTTFAAFATVARPYIQETISRSPATLAEGTRSLPALRPFFRHSAQFFTAFEPGAQALAETSPDLATAFRTGAPVLADAHRLNDELEPTAQALLDFQEADGVDEGLELLSDTNRILDPTLGFIAPAQTVCNYLTLLFRNIASVGQHGDGLGTWSRFITFAPALGPNSESSPAAGPASGPHPVNYLHYNPYPNTASPGQPLECEAGNEGYLFQRNVIGNVPGRQSVLTGAQTKDQLRRGGEE
jgi:ABC-type transporter Mla subunit MlaD